MMNGVKKVCCAWLVLLTVAPSGNGGEPDRPEDDFEVLQYVMSWRRFDHLGRQQVPTLRECLTRLAEHVRRHDPDSRPLILVANPSDRRWDTPVFAEDLVREDPFVASRPGPDEDLPFPEFMRRLNLSFPGLRIEVDEGDVVAWFDEELTAEWRRLAFRLSQPLSLRLREVEANRKDGLRGWFREQGVPLRDRDSVVLRGRYLHVGAWSHHLERIEVLLRNLGDAEAAAVATASDRDGSGAAAVRPQALAVIDAKHGTLDGSMEDSGRPAVMSAELRLGPGVSEGVRARLEEAADNFGPSHWNWEKVAELLMEALTGDEPSSQDGWREESAVALGWFLGQLHGSIPQAQFIGLCRAAVERYGGDAMPAGPDAAEAVWFWLGAGLMQDGNHDRQALEALTRCLRILQTEATPDGWKEYITLQSIGEVRNRLGEFEAAVDPLRRALAFIRWRADLSPLARPMGIFDPFDPFGPQGFWFDPFDPPAGEGDREVEREDEDGAPPEDRGEMPPVDDPPDQPPVVPYQEHAQREWMRTVMLLARALDGSGSREEARWLLRGAVATWARRYGPADTEFLPAALELLESME